MSLTSRIELQTEVVCLRAGQGNYDYVYFCHDVLGVISNWINLKLFSSHYNWPFVVAAILVVVVSLLFSMLLLLHLFGLFCFCCL